MRRSNNACPYCRAEFPTPRILARHKDRCAARERVATILPTPDAFEARKQALVLGETSFARAQGKRKATP